MCGKQYLIKPIASFYCPCLVSSHFLLPMCPCDTTVTEISETSVCEIGAVPLIETFLLLMSRLIKVFFFFFLNVYLVLVPHTIPIYVVSIGSCLFHAPVICLSAWVSRWRWWSQISTLWPTTWSRSGCMWRQRSSWSRGSTVMCWRQLRGCTALHGSQSSSASTSIVSFSLG